MSVFKINSEEFEKEDFNLLDATGLKCPEPVMLLHKTVKRVGENALIKILASDPSTERDIPRFCEFLKHDLLAAIKQENSEPQYIYWVRTRKN